MVSSGKIILDTKITAGLILTICGIIVTSYISGTNKISMLESRVKALENITKNNTRIIERLTSVEAQTKATKDGVDRLQRSVDELNRELRRVK